MKQWLRKPINWIILLTAIGVLSAWVFILYGWLGSSFTATEIGKDLLIATLSVACVPLVLGLTYVAWKRIRKLLG